VVGSAGIAAEHHSTGAVRTVPGDLGGASDHSGWEAGLHLQTGIGDDPGRSR